MSDEQDSITVYSDYVCPFCYLGRRSLSEYQDTRAQPLDIAWHPFDLRRQKRGPDGEIDHSVDDGKDEAYFEEVKENVAQLKEKYGAEAMLGIDETPDVDSFNAQVAASYVDVEHPDAWLAFDEAVFEALWIDGRDIDDPDVLAELADSVGLDGDEIREAIDDGTNRERLEDAFTSAQRSGVSGVPMFVYDGRTARGAVPPEHLRRLVEGT
jgi:predicted DsbA family dithiol-disulfide isomerase